jgi:hypothetical protein
MIGDKPTDSEAGTRARCQTILLTALQELDLCDSTSEVTTRDWPGVVQYVKGQMGAAV